MDNLSTIFCTSAIITLFLLPILGYISTFLDDGKLKDIIMVVITFMIPLIFVFALLGAHFDK